MATYPLLPVACDIDYEVGNLIRLVVANTAKDAISCEEPWVIAGLETAEREEDRVVRTLEQFLRRYSHRSESVPDEPLEADLEAVAPDTNSGAAMDESAGPAEMDDTEAAEPTGALDFSQPLVVAVQAAVIRCRALLDRLSDLTGKAPDPGEGDTNPNPKQPS
jgi:hypothetical protein